MNNTANNKRIAKNTLLLYFRMLFIMAINLYTSRIVLKILGIEDFGIYNAVGGIVAMFGFLTSAMSISTQRYITYELGKNNLKQLNKIFNTSITIHAVISVIILILAETIGLWFLYNKMTIPIERLNAALWTYQASIASAMILIMSIPYNATIIAHEKMSAFAYISVLEVVLKLAIVYLLLISNFDKLKLYSTLILIVQLIIRIIYGQYCKKHFLETKIHCIKDKSLFKEMLSFAGWNLWGNCAGIASTQGVNILLNIFFGPHINAARGIAVQVQGAVNQFASNFQTAINPQITKSYAQGDYNYMHNLIFSSSKFTFYLLLLLTLPLQIETKTILNFWLETVPDYTEIFLRLILCVTVIDATANPLMISASATGKIKTYQSIVGSILFLIFPLSYLFLKLGTNPESVFIIHLLICILAFIVRLFIVRSMIQLNLTEYVKKVIIRIIFVAITATILTMGIKFFLNDNTFFNFIILCFSSTIIVIILSYSIGLEKNEKKFITCKIKNIINKIRR